MLAFIEECERTYIAATRGEITMTRRNQDADQNSQFNDHDTRWGLSRRSFVELSAASAGILGLAGNTTAASPDDDPSEKCHHGDGLSTDEIMQLMLDRVGFDEVPADTGIYVDGDDIQTALVGIDIEGTGLHLAHQMGFDVAIAHHPTGGWPIISIHQLIFDAGVDIMTDHGVPEDEAEAAAAENSEPWHFDALSSVEDHVPSLAELLDQPYMNIHNPVDELARREFADVAENLPPETTVGELKEIFNEEFPEVRAQRPEMTTAVGNDDNEIGDLAVYHGAGTNGGATVASAFYDNGIDTVMYIHVGYDDVQQLRDEYGDEKNLVIIGHVPGDGVGMRIMIETLEENGVDVTPMAGALTGPEQMTDAEWQERQDRQNGAEVPPRAGRFEDDEDEAEPEAGGEDEDEETNTDDEE